MKRDISLIFMLLISISAVAQDPYELFVKAFADNYNNQNYAAVYDLTNDAFKAQVTKDQIVQVLTGAYAGAGKITEAKEQAGSGQGKVYLLVCEKASFELSVGLDTNGKAAGLYLRPAGTQGPKDPASLINNWKANKLNAGLVVGRIRDGKPDVQYYGFANKATSTPVDSKTIFEIGSISKPMTGIIMHMLIAEGKISLDDPVNKFLPKDSHLPKVKGSDILIRHLVTHSSCLPRMPANFNPPAGEEANPYSYYSEKDLLAYLVKFEPGDCELGKSSQYSNLGAGLLGYILTKVSGKTYPALFNERMVKPLKTENFGVIGKSDRWALGYTAGGEVQSQWTFTDALVGAGGVDSSADDMLKLILFLMKPDQSALGKAVSASTALQMPGPQGGGLATFWIRQSKGEQTVLWHNGRTGGFNAFIGWVEGTQNGLFILDNNGDDFATTLGIAMMGEEK